MDTDIHARTSEPVIYPKHSSDTHPCVSVVTEPMIKKRSIVTRVGKVRRVREVKEDVATLTSITSIAPIAQVRIFFTASVRGS